MKKALALILFFSSFSVASAAFPNCRMNYTSCKYNEEHGGDCQWLEFTVRGQLIGVCGPNLKGKGNIKLFFGSTGTGGSGSSVGGGSGKNVGGGNTGGSSGGGAISNGIVQFVKSLGNLMIGGSVGGGTTPIMINPKLNFRTLGPSVVDTLGASAYDLCLLNPKYCTENGFYSWGSSFLNLFKKTSSPATSPASVGAGAPSFNKQVFRGFRALHPGGDETQADQIKRRVWGSVSQQENSLRARTIPGTRESGGFIY